MDLLLFLALLILGLVVSFVNVLAGGGGGLVKTSALIFVGLSPQQAIATMLFAWLPATISASYKFYKENQIVKELVFPLVMIGMVSTALGAMTLVTLQGSTIETLIAFCMLAVLPFLFGKDLGLYTRHRSKNYQRVGWAMMFFVTFIAILTGGGGGIFAGYVLIYFFGLTFIKSNATTAGIWFFTNLLASLFFFWQGLIQIEYAIPLMIGNTIGAYIGAHTAVKKGNKFVRIAFSVVVVLMALKLLLF